MPGISTHMQVTGAGIMGIMARAKPRHYTCVCSSKFLKPGTASGVSIYSSISNKPLMSLERSELLKSMMLEY